MIEYEFRALKTWSRQKTDPCERHSPFKASLSTTYSELAKELRFIGASGKVVFEIGLRESEIRNDGRPRADARKPEFPGIVLNISKTKHGPLQFICDDCRSWEENLRAIVLTMEHLRGADRYGVTKAGEQYRGWKQLPGGIVTPPPMSVEDAALFVSLGSGVTKGEVLDSHEHFRRAYRTKASQLHPDATGGTTSADWHRLQAAKTVLESHHGARS